MCEQEVWQILFRIIVFHASVAWMHWAYFQSSIFLRRKIESSHSHKCFCLGVDAAKTRRAATAFSGEATIQQTNQTSGVEAIPLDWGWILDAGWTNVEGVPQDWLEKLRENLRSRCQIIRILLFSVFDGFLLAVK